MSQTRAGSLVETIVNVAVGFVLSLCLQMFLAWWYGLKTSVAVDLQICLWFTVLSLARSYVLRRAFNRFGTQLMCLLDRIRLRLVRLVEWVRA